MYTNTIETLNVYQALNSYDKVLSEKDWSLDEGYKVSLEIMKIHSKSFYFASQSLTPDQQKSVASLYAFSRLVDDIVDESNYEKNDINKILDRIKDQVTKLALKGYTSDNLILKTFGYTIQKHNIPIQYIHDLIEGVRMDLSKSEYYTIQELDLYCYRVASTIGLMMVHIMVDDPEDFVLARAKDLGLAMQLTNILRDVKEDYEKGRIYLPYETRAEYGIENSDIEKEFISPKFRKMIKFEIERAKGLYKTAELGIYELPKEAQFTILLASEVYMEILNQIERNKYQILNQRAVVSKTRKIFIMIKTRINYSFKKLMNFTE